MENTIAAPDRFWREFNSDVAGTLSDVQRHEIERVLRSTETAPDKKLGDLRMSFKWFFVRLVWGPERRSQERINEEQSKHPVMAGRNLPMLASMAGGYLAFLFGILAVSYGLFYYFFNAA